MSRSRNAVASHKRRKKLRKQARGYYGARSRQLRTLRDAVNRAGMYSYAHRRKRPGDFRRLWIMRINAASREHGLSYSKFMHGLSLLNVEVDRKILAELAVNKPFEFKALAEQANAALQ
ncbi:MAG: 50S ribosomal protein L20 [Candidatus Hatepunaea meridiana]|nr:50S ribosomal protein L20 [Candidatus Hatepunaea meridiana]